MNKGEPSPVAKVAHISDIHFPRLSDANSAWRRRWESIAARLRAERPDFIVVTGDVINSAWPQLLARPHLETILSKELPNAFGGIPFVVVPGNHDIKTIQGLGGLDHEFASLFRELTRDKGGWHEPIHDRVHIFTIDSNHSTWMARGRILETDLEAAVVPPECADKHVHLFALHHSFHVEPQRAGENAVTTDPRMLGLDNADDLLETIARQGFDIILHGHRHLSTFKWYADPRAERRTSACFLIGAPSATKTNWQGYNYIQDDEHGAFEVHSVEQSQGAWRDARLVASRDYEEARMRRWKRQAREGQPSCDRFDVWITSYQEGSEAEREAQILAGDVKVEVELQKPVNLGSELAFPLVKIVGYEKGIVPRALSASWIDDTGAVRSLRVNTNGTIDVQDVRQPRSIRASVVLLNAVPSSGGDWERMRNSQPTLQDVVDVRLAMPAQHLRLRVDVKRVQPLLTIARRPSSLEHLTPESGFTAVYSDSSVTDGCRQEITAFRPLAGVGYCLTSSADPARGEPAGSIPLGAAVLQKKLAEVKDHPELRVEIQTKLTKLRETVIELARALPNSQESDADISTDLMSISSRDQEGGGIRVEITDWISEAHFASKSMSSSVNVRFPWGRGVAGRALRLQKWLTWRRDQYNQPHPSAWPARDCYVPVLPVEKHGEHTYIYCGPLFVTEEDQAYMVGMLSFASQADSTLMKHVITAARDPNRYKQFNDDFGEAVRTFSTWLGIFILKADN